jgi:hypothetical protein
MFEATMTPVPQAAPNVSIAILWHTKSPPGNAEQGSKDRHEN